MGRSTPTVGRQVLMAAVFLAIVVAVALLGSLATIPHANGWYADVEKVAWSPPNWLFGPAWSVLYLLIAITGFLTWRAGHAGGGSPNRARNALVLFAIQLVLNAAWTPIFFAGYPAIGPAAWWIALVVIVLLVAIVAVLIPVTAKWSKTAAWLLVPYLAWLAFATTLNVGIVVLN